MMDMDKLDKFMDFLMVWMILPMMILMGLFLWGFILFVIGAVVVTIARLIIG